MASVDVKKWVFVKYPETFVGEEHYELQTDKLETDLSAGELLIELHYVSVDPYLRIRQNREASNFAPVQQLGTVQISGAVGQVVASKSSTIAVGDFVQGYLPWQTHVKAHTSEVRKLDPTIAPVSTALGVLGMPGRTAWFGLTVTGEAHTGEVVVVSGAAGAVGSLVVQYAKRHGCKVLGIAGGAAKCEWVRTALHADWAIDYKTYSDAETLSAEIKRLTGGVDVYFDNVGGMVTDAIIPIVNKRARVVICGSISQYSLDKPELGPRFLHHLIYQRAKIEGMLVFDYDHRADEMDKIVGPWVSKGEVVFEETVMEGFEQLPKALNSLFTGDHKGKLLVKIK